MKKISTIYLPVALAGIISFSGLVSFSQVIQVPISQPTIQQGIDAANEGDTVLVDEGTYFENIDFTGKAITVASRFLLDGDTSHISRTIINGSQSVNPDTSSVVLIAGGHHTGAVLSGFTITGGTGTMTDPVKEVYHGGGIYINETGAILDHNRIIGNMTEKPDCGSGGIGAFLSEGDTLIVSHNIIADNHVTTEVLTGCAGLGIISAKNAQVLVHDNVIARNQITTSVRYKAVAGGVYLQVDYGDHADIRFYNNLVSQNEVHCQSSFGGGFYIVYSRFTEDPVSHAQVRLYNNVITGNYSQDKGGGIAIWNTEYETLRSSTPVDPVLINNTISGNISSDGSGLYNYDARTLLFNNILQDSISDSACNEIFQSSIDYCFPSSPRWCKDKNDGILYAWYNNIQDGWPGAGNIDVGSVFDPASYELTEGDFCIGHGADSVLLDGRWYYAPKEDFYGNERPYPSSNNRVDLGAVESDFDNPIPYPGETYINVPGTIPTIQAAIDSAVDGDIILADPGIYYENINFRGKAVTVASHYLMEPDERYIASTILDGSQSTDPDTASAVLMISGEDTTSVLYGMTITGGKGTYIEQDGIKYLVGGGFLGINGGGRIEQNIVENNILPDSKYDTYTFGNGICARVENEKTLIIRDNMIRNNHFHGTNNALGAGLCLWGGRILVEGNLITGNFNNSQREATGGGIAYFGSDNEGVVQEVTIRNNLFYGNLLTSWGYEPCGGGLFIRGYNLPLDIRIYNNIFQNNKAYTGSGAGIEVWEASPVIYNNNFLNNRAQSGRELAAGKGAVPRLFNNILWSTVNDGSSEIYIHPDENAGVVAAYNDILGGWEGEGNIDANPRFEAGSLELSEESPCVGMGINQIEIEGMLYYAPALDMNGHPRPDPVDAFVDIGATESPFRNEPPSLTVSFLHQDTLEITSTEEGTIYLVPENTAPDLTDINDSKLQDPLAIPKDTTVKMTLQGLDDGIYWIYAINSRGKLSEHYSFERITSSREAHLSEQFTLYPNPATDYVTLALSNSGLYTVEIISATGQRLNREDFTGSPHRLVLTSYRPGLYYITVRSERSIWTKKIIIQ